MAISMGERRGNMNVFARVDYLSLLTFISSITDIGFALIMMHVSRNRKVAKG
jgi:hypothetical protein